MSSFTVTVNSRLNSTTGFLFWFKISSNFCSMVCNLASNFSVYVFFKSALFQHPHQEDVQICNHCWSNSLYAYKQSKSKWNPNTLCHCVFLHYKQSIFFKSSTVSLRLLLSYFQTNISLCAFLASLPSLLLCFKFNTLLVQILGIHSLHLKLPLALHLLFC